jgi:hypothetical protein
MSEADSDGGSTGRVEAKCAAVSVTAPLVGFTCRYAEEVLGPASSLSVFDFFLPMKSHQRKEWTASDVVQNPKVPAKFLQATRR